jgi:hypothetical protein
LWTSEWATGSMSPRNPEPTTGHPSRPVLHDVPEAMALMSPDRTLIYELIPSRCVFRSFSFAYREP